MLITLIRIQLSVFRERQEYVVFRELIRMVPGLEARLMESSEEEIIAIADLVTQATILLFYFLTYNQLDSRYRKVQMVQGQMTPKG